MVKVFFMADLSVVKEKYRVGIIIVLLLICIVFTYLFHFRYGEGAVFTQFFYVPIVLAAIWWQRKGILVPIFLSVLLIFSDFLSKNLTYPVYDDLFRIFMFMAVGVVVVLLSEQIAGTEKRLRESEAKFRSVSQSAVDGIITTDSNGDIVILNESILKIFGYHKGELEGRPVTILMPDRFRKNFIEILDEFQLTGKHELAGKIFESMGQRKDGTEFPMELSLATWTSKKEIFTTSIIRDVSERKIIQEKLAESERSYRAIFENTGTATVIIEEDYTISLINTEFEKLSGYPKDELEGKRKWTDFVAEEDLEITEYYHNIRREYPNIAPGRYDFKFIDGNNNIKHVLAKVAAIPGTKKSLASLLDITQRKRAEEELKLSQIRLSNAMDLANLANWELDPYKQIYILNDKFYSLLGTNAEDEGGYTMPIEYYIKEFVHPEDAHFIAEEMKKSFMVREPTFGTEFEHRIIRKDGKTRYVAIRIRYIPPKESQKTLVYGTVQDITERKIAEKKLKESLEEKELLIKEIHHRVKNNLMVISSLLNLQSSYIKDKQALDIFKESESRARSMALIHERLYRSSDLKRINFGDYIRTLATDLYHTYITDPSRVKLNLDIDNLMIDINTTVPLGLTVNELVSNSLKHAFPGDLKGEINIDFHKIGDDFILKVYDTGIGFPEGLDFRNTDSLGLQLVNSLVGQIDGEIELDRSHGTGFTIKFKEIEYEKS